MAGNIGILNMTQSVGSFKLAPKILRHGHFEAKFPHLKFSVWGSDSFLIVPNMHPSTPLLSHRRPPSRTRDRRNYAGFLGVPWVKPKDLSQCFNESRTHIILKDRLKKRQNNISQKKIHRTLLPQRQNPERLVGEMRESTETACFFRCIHDVSDAWLQCWLIILMTFRKSMGIFQDHSFGFLLFFKFSVPFICHTRVPSLYRGRASPLRKPSNELRKQQTILLMIIELGSYKVCVCFSI